MIKEIHCFGTSHTAGGGFEFFHDIRESMLLKNYSEEPYTQFNYSYPGQLQKIIGDDIKVFNHGKSGYGNERIYRKVFDIVENSESLDDKIFIIEFSNLGRKEIWSNTHKKHLIVNYNFIEDGTVYISGIAHNYFTDGLEIETSIRNIILPYFKETFELFNQQKIVNQNIEFFISYLFQNKVKFLVLEQPDHPTLKEKTKPYLIDFGDGIYNMVEYCYAKNLTITDETNNAIKDGHGGLEWSKHVAKKISEKIIHNL